MRLALVLKARPVKYIKRWKGKNGKWYYKYKENKGYWYEKEVYKKGRILASLSRKYNVEFGTVIDLKTGKFMGGISKGIKDKVDMEKNVEEAYEIFKENRSKRFVMMHSHIHDRSFSHHNISLLLKGSRRGIKKSVVYGIKNSIYELEALEGKVYKERTEAEVEYIYTTTMDGFSDSIKEDWKIWRDKTVKKVADILGLKYRRRMR